MNANDREQAARPHPGEYEHPQDQVTTEGLRRQFLDRLATVRPQVLEDLAGRPREIYHQMWLDAKNAGALTSSMGPIFDLIWGKLPGWNSFKYANESWDRPLYVEMRSLLLAWSEKWHLVDDWILDAAVETLAVWAPHPERLTESDLRFRDSADSVPMLGFEQVRFTFSHRGWQPTLQRWPDAKKEIRQAFQQALKEYESSIRAAAEAEGWVRTKDRRRRKDQSLRMDRVVLYVVDQLTSEGVAQALAMDSDLTEIDNASTEAVAKAVRELSPLMGLTVRS